MTSAKTALTHLAESFFRRKAPAIPPASTPALTGQTRRKRKVAESSIQDSAQRRHGQNDQNSGSVCVFNGHFRKKGQHRHDEHAAASAEQSVHQPRNDPRADQGHDLPRDLSRGAFLNESVFSIPWSMRFICVFIWHKFGKSKKNAVIDLLFYLKYYILFVTFKNLTLKKVNV